MERLLQLYKDESGQDLIEYVMLAALLVIAAIVLLGTVASSINSEFSKVIAALT
ncbi:MAG TPA: Flp family type IVb pilin [Terriglobales bacterium]|jgi:Flp pilus assembly pilin Flp|nr:Flp family type IVb pilin [Terriglobales bacterium]